METSLPTPMTARVELLIYQRVTCKEQQKGKNQKHMNMCNWKTMEKPCENWEHEWEQKSNMNVIEPETMVFFPWNSSGFPVMFPLNQTVECMNRLTVESDESWTMTSGPSISGVFFASNDGVFDRETMGNYGKINLNYPYQKLYTKKPLEFRSTPILDKSIQIDMRMTSLIVKGLNLVTHPDNWTHIWTSPFLMGEIMYRCAIHSYVQMLDYQKVVHILPNKIQNVTMTMCGSALPGFFHGFRTFGCQ